MTIKDLAAKTGYAVGTVSRTLNNHPNVSEKARKAILQAAEESNFQINQNAKQLKQQRTTTILVVVKGTQNELFGELVEAIQNLIAKTPYQLVIDYADENNNEVCRGAQLCREKKPLGIMFLGGNRKNFAEHFQSIDVPCVLVTGDASSLSIPNLSSVFTDDFAAARCAVATLIEMGHKNVAIIGGDDSTSDTSSLRYRGSIRAFQDHSLPFDTGYYRSMSHYSYQQGYLATLDLLDNGPPFTAIFAIADVMAIGAIRALQERGLQVPADVSVMGVDGLPIGDYLTPQLATIRQSVAQMASDSVEILLESIQRGAKAVHKKIPFTTECRESVCSLTE